MSSMKNIRLWLLLAFLAGFNLASVHAQPRNYGTVVDVVDGKTVVVALPTGQVKIELQYIDAPEAGQPLHAFMKDQLRLLLGGKAVEVQTKGFTRERLTGKLVLDGVDISHQLLRNGNAWHVPMDKSGQGKDEFASYAESETLARLEKRGVWSIAGLEPAWVFRERKRTALFQSKPVGDAAESSQPKAGTKGKGYWSDENPRLKNPGAMTYGFNAATQTGFLGTSTAPIYDMVAKKAVPTAAIDITYYYTEMPGNGRKGYFVVTVFCSLNDPLFAKSETMTVHVDGKNSVVKRVKRDVENRELRQVERLTYYLDKELIHRLTHGGDAYIMLGKYNIRMMDGIPQLLYNILEFAS